MLNSVEEETQLDDESCEVSLLELLVDDDDQSVLLSLVVEKDESLELEESLLELDEEPDHPLELSEDEHLLDVLDVLDFLEVEEGQDVDHVSLEVVEVDEEHELDEVDDQDGEEAEVEDVRLLEDELGGGVQSDAYHSISLILSVEDEGVELDDDVDEESEELSSVEGQ